MIKFKKTLENKWETSDDGRELRYQEGYRGIEIQIRNYGSEGEGMDVLMAFERYLNENVEEFDFYVWDGSTMCFGEELGEITIIIDEEYIKEFNAIYKTFKEGVVSIVAGYAEEIEAAEEIVYNEVVAMVNQIKEGETTKVTQHTIYSQVTSCFYEDSKGILRNSAADGIKDLARTVSCTRSYTHYALINGLPVITALGATTEAQVVTYIVDGEHFVHCDKKTKPRHLRCILPEYCNSKFVKLGVDI